MSDADLLIGDARLEARRHQTIVMSVAVVVCLWAQFLFPQGKGVSGMNIEDIPVHVRLAFALVPLAFLLVGRAVEMLLSRPKALALRARIHRDMLGLLLAASGLHMIVVVFVEFLSLALSGGGRP